MFDTDNMNNNAKAFLSKNPGVVIGIKIYIIKKLTRKF